MLTLFDFYDSGNGYKVRLLLNLLQRPFRYVEVDILKGESRTDEFLQRNPNGRIPVLQIGVDQYLTESNAILYWLGVNTRFWPQDTLAQAQVLRWMFFEQYSHEPNIATSRFIRHHREVDAATQALLAQKLTAGHAALAVMERHLKRHDFLVGKSASIADIALYAYTHVAPEGGFELDDYAAIRAWLARIAKLDHYVPITNTAGLATA